MEAETNLSQHHRKQIVIPERDAWADWLDPFVPAQTLIVEQMD